jgi:adenylate cyclase
MTTGEPERVERRLTAILAADVVGYSRLMGTDEEGTLAALKVIRRELVDPRIAEHRGRIVKTTGDGLLVEFASVVNAVRCAVEVQRAMVEREPELPEEQRIRLRIGINLGDIIVERGDIFGDGVNIAARLEALANPGGLCVSGAVRDQIGGRLPYAFADDGEQWVKNIDRPVRVFTLSAAAIAGTPLSPVKPPYPTARTGVATPAPRLSIVVMPFTNTSRDPDQDYFVDAVTDGLTTDLSRISGSFVISRSTAFTYKGKSIDAKQIGHDLGVRYVLEGKVRRDDNRVQVNVTLTDSESGAYIWTDKFAVDRGNLTEAQNEIIARLAHALELTMVGAAARNIERDRSSNTDADDFVMRGWASYRRLNSETNLNEAQQYFEHALSIDPKSVEAKIGLSNVLMEYFENGRRHIVDGVVVPPAHDLARVEELLLDVSEWNASDPHVLRILGRLRRAQNRLTEAKILLEKAILLDPNDITALHVLGITLIFLGDPQAAIPYFRKGLQVNPRSPNVFWADWWLGLANLLLRDTDQAIDFFYRALAANPRFAPTPLFLAAALGLKGDIDGAKASLAEGLKLRPEPRSIKQFQSSAPWQAGSPKYCELREKTVIAGWRLAGMPEE